MADPLWGLLAKSQIDPELIEAAIARLITAHNDDPDAHIEEGQSLQSHKASEIIDHVVHSIVEDKIDTGAVSSRAITTDQIIGKDFRTAENVGAAVDGVKFASGGIELWQGGERRVWIPVSGDAIFKGRVKVQSLRYTRDVVQTYWESLDSFDQAGAIVSPGLGYLYLSTDNVSGHETYISNVSGECNFDASPEFETRLKCEASTSQLIYFGMGLMFAYGGYSSSDRMGVGFKINNGDLYAFNCNGTSETTDLLTGIDVTEWHTYFAVYSSGALFFFVDEALVSVSTTDLPTGVPPLCGYYVKTTTGSSRIITSKYFVRSQDVA